MIEKLKAKERELLDNMKLFAQPLKIAIFSLFTQSLVSLLVQEERKQMLEFVKYLSKISADKEDMVSFIIDQMVNDVGNDQESSDEDLLSPKAFADPKKLVTLFN